METVSRRLLRDEAYDALLRAIVTGELAPGQRLQDGRLAADLGLSREPVRQALARLTAERLVVSKPQSYTRVAPVDAREVADALDVVRTLHELAVRTAVPRMGTEDVAAMRAENARFGRAVADGDTMAAIAADDALHDVPVRVCGNRALAETVQRYTPLLRRLELRQFSTEAARASYRRHEALIAACAAADTEAAQTVTAEIWSELADLIDRH